MKYLELWELYLNVLKLRFMYTFVLKCIAYSWLSEWPLHYWPKPNPLLSCSAHIGPGLTDSGGCAFLMMWLSTAVLLHSSMQSTTCDLWYKPFVTPAQRYGRQLLMGLESWPSLEERTTDPSAQASLLELHKTAFTNTGLLL